MGLRDRLRGRGAESDPEEEPAEIEAEEVVEEIPVPDLDAESEIADAESQIRELSDRISSMEMDQSTLGNEIRSIKRDTFEMSDNIRNLLYIYDVVKKETNPFVEYGRADGTKSDADRVKEEFSKHAQLFQLLRSTENLLERVYLSKMKGKAPEPSDLEELDRRYKEFLGW